MALIFKFPVIRKGRLRSAEFMLAIKALKVTKYIGVEEFTKFGTSSAASHANNHCVDDPPRSFTNYHPTPNAKAKMFCNVGHAAAQSTDST